MPAGIFERHHLAIYRYLLRMLGSRDRAEELTQDVFVHALKGADRYEERSQERAWLFRIARNLRLDALRRDRRTPAESIVDGVDDNEPRQPAQQALQASLRQALAMLPDDEREAFVLAEVVGLSYGEIADACSATPAAVRSRIYRARMQLRAVLDRPTAARPLV
jgi:RNA polymerase sigma-70 factor (ECF subfamily)